MPPLNAEQGSSTAGFRHLLFWAGILAVLVVLLAARPALAWWAERTARGHLQAGRLGAAEQYLARAVRLGRQDVATQVLIARTYRYLDQHDRWRRAVERARAASPAAKAVESEQRMGALRWGLVLPVPEDEWERLVDAEVQRDEAAIAVVYGLLVTGEDLRCEQLLNRWEQVADHPQQVAFLRGVRAQSRQQWQEAENFFRAALELEPEHEMAHAALAQLAENQGKLHLAAVHFAYWAQHRPDNEQAVTGWSRVLRHLGRAREARQVLQQFAASSQLSPPLILEWAHVAFELGDYDEAVRRFRHADLEGPHEVTTLLTAATALALQGDTSASQAIFGYVDRTSDQQRRIEVLQKRVAADLSDQQAAEELRELSREVITLSWSAPERREPVASELFLRHCAACHGDRGEGDGPGAKHLYPPARNLRWDEYRLVTGINGSPLPADIESVIRNGIPGTAMPPFPNLAPDEQRGLAAEVLQMRLQGIREQRIERLRAGGEEVDEASVDGWIQRLEDAARPLAVPAIQPSATEGRMDEARRLYREGGCAQCHGEDGRGNSGVPLFNNDGSHAVPRDLVFEPMKGGAGTAALFARLRLGMPGTPHPANPTLDDQQVLSLVAYCQSLAKQAGPPLTNRQRSVRANRQAMRARFGPLDASPPGRFGGREATLNSAE